MLIVQEALPPLTVLELGEQVIPVQVTVPVGVGFPAGTVRVAVKVRVDSKLGLAGVPMTLNARVALATGNGAPVPSDWM